ncbi:MAG: hypothetical protein L0228_00905 [Planctomycetes bacterium]|nr:hypothetical protein [Planctomycetota bacterium]
MSPRSKRRIVLRANAALICAALMGCASWQGPRIDPSGERIFIWPNQAPTPVAASPVTSPFDQTPPVSAPVVGAPPPGAPVIQTPPIAPITPPTGIGAPVGNVQAPPVYSDPTPMPGAAVPAAGSSWNPFAPNVVAPAVTAPGVPAATPLPLTTMRPAGMPGVATPLGNVAPSGVPYLRVTPNGIMAPVGTEVVLKASICNCDGTPLVNRRVEWGIAGAGQFTELGAPYQVGYFNWSWNTPRRIAYNHAVGSTALVETTLYRGTPDPNDDVPIARGESWVTITSACEGTSLVTACTPALDNYNRVTATVYWVDAQFFFPPPAMAEPGRPHVLTTTVTRRSDNAPLAGWTVRYDVAGGASLGYEGGNFVQATTDTAGRANVEVSPVDPGGGTTNVGISIFRPAIGGAPQLGLGRGNTTITWGAGVPAVPVDTAPGVTAPGPPGSSPFNPYSPSAPSLPSAPVSPPGGAPPQSDSPAPSLPNSSTSPPDRYTPPAGEPAAGKPQLQVQLRATSPTEVAVGEFVSFEVSITNTGDGTARGMRIRDQFDPGLRHPSAKPNELAVENAGIRDLAPDQSTSVPLTLQVLAEGSHCHTVTVSAEGAQPASQRACATGIKPAIELRVTGPRSRVVGETAPFDVVVRNQGNVAALNVEVVLRFDAALEPTEIVDPSHQRLPDGGVSLDVGNIPSREQRTFHIVARCKSASNNACARADLTADGGFTTTADACVEVLPPSPAGTGNVFGP